ncbi:tetratricopeptide repeat protein [Streptomyces brasiliscabiei]|uniref:Tetratricopeptide repeat protein n=1 Tax=Streptomyces brasiliscabiei TaxID=2736302 RepID=A0ABU8GM33_9ACTN
MSSGASAEASGNRSIAGRDIGLAITGDHTLFVGRMTAPLPPEAYELPACTSATANLPDANGLFVGRERELSYLNRVFTQVGSVVVHAVRGLGGVGKSTLAVRWAAGRSDSYNPVWWMTAETEADLDAGLADLAVALRPALGDMLSRKALRDLAVQWLSTHEGWLLILDNVSDPAHVKPLLDRATNGRYLITTRRAAGWQGIAETLSLGVLDPPEAVELFESVYCGPVAGGATESGPVVGRADVHEPVAGVDELCRELGFLPLAVRQAASYCREADITPERYREQLAAYPEQVLAHAPAGGRTVARVWRVTLDRLADTPLPGQILRVIAWWAPDGIHRSYLEPLGSPPQVTEALRRLAAHSMITLRGDEISVHRLVQAVARAGEPGDPHRSPEAVAAARDTAAALLHEPAVEAARAIQTDWFTHAEAYLGHREADTEESVRLLVLVDRWRRTFQDEGGVETVQRVVELASRICGPRHPVTLLARANLAEELLARGHWTAARDFLLRNLISTAFTCGRKHPDRIMARARLAGPTLASGNVFAALGIVTRCLRRAERALGPDHEVTVKIGIMVANVWVQLAEVFPRRTVPRAVSEVERLYARADPAGDAALMLTADLLSLHTMSGNLEQAFYMAEEFAEGLAVSHGEAHASTLYARAQQLELLMEYGQTGRARTVLDPLRADWERLTAAQVSRIPGALLRAMERLLLALPAVASDR